jgi:hypothetical protein
LFSKKLDLFQVGSYALIASGGFSNWIDRARFDGVVVDFMNMGLGPVRTGVFNVADIAILVGIGLLFVHSSRLEKQAKAAAAAGLKVVGASDYKNAVKADAKANKSLQTANSSGDNTYLYLAAGALAAFLLLRKK